MSDPRLLEDLFRLTRGDLDTATFSPPVVSSVFAGSATVRLLRWEAIWNSGGNEIARSPEEAAAQFVGGMSGLGCRWLYAVRCERNELECWFGVDEATANPAQLRRMLRGAFTDSRMADGAAPGLSGFAGAAGAVQVTGIPAAFKPRPGEPPADRLEKLCRALQGTDWLYLVQLEPVPHNDVVRGLNALTAKIQDVHANHLLRGNAVDEQNRTAKRLVDLLQAQLSRYETGRSLGMWNGAVHLLIRDAALLPIARSLLQAAFSAGEPSVVPLRARVCVRGGNAPEMEPLTTDEVAVFIRPPTESYPGFEVAEPVRFGVQAPLLDRAAPCITVGVVMDRGTETGNHLRLPLLELTRHGLVAGLTGGGKTNTCLGLLEQLWVDHGIPFLVVESAKSEYRRLLNDPRFPGLNVITAGDETIAPLRLNPFEVPDGILVQTHIDYLKSLFAAAFVLYPPMPYVLERSLHEVYVDRGWDLSRNVNLRDSSSPRRFPDLRDLARKVADVTDRMGYDRRLTMDVKAGLLARIDQLRVGGGKAPMFASRTSVSSSKLFDAPCVLELKQIVSDDEKAFLIGLLLIRLAEYREATGRSGAHALRHVMLIEEAHRLLRNAPSDSGNEVSANPRGRAVEVFASILAEVRAYGQGILIAEQIPVKLTRDVIKNTNLKIAHRVVDEEDRRLLGGAMSLSEAQMKALGRLRVGEAAVYLEGVNEATLVRIPLARVLSQPSPTDEQVRDRMHGTRRAAGLSTPVPTEGCHDCPLAPPGSQCSAREGERLRPALERPFRRLLNAVRLGSAGASAQWTEFTGSVRGQLSVHGRPLDPYCLFVELLEDEIESRARYWSCSYSEVDRAMDALLDRVRGMAAGEPTVGGSEMTRHWATLHAPVALPYAGCVHCERPCAYRFDMTAAPNGMATEFGAAFRQRALPLSGLAGICDRAARGAFDPGDPSNVTGAAICFAVQQLAELGIPGSRQSSLAGKLAVFLRGGGAKNG